MVFETKQQGYSRKHYLKNCDKISERNRKRVLCKDCNKTYSFAYISKHICLCEK